ncbi:sodium/proline symporter [Arcanobacterium pluranimalium]|uniref:sodium/proline symporter PutP n=1 Tax=Arcanobacterium pluranimalium TaxID=108028 RepID=UPI001956C228|nr:sodium/proline symporter PutP [Arcanobacterium pluranimalium]MBM7825710.1 sodium/proline symporter [Arcanobacterium pluranimalium]
MDQVTGQAIAMIIYFVAMVIIGIWAYTRTKNVDDYMLGGRDLNPTVAALSAGASDMSGWLLMGLPGALYISGLVEAWIAVGLTVGAWVNWKVVAPRLRSYTQVAGNSITVPSFLGNRLRDSSRSVRIVAGLIIFVFFTFYVSSGMVAGGVFFESAFGMDYHLGMTLVAGVVVLYTLVGGFLAVSWTDMVQGLMMLAALVAVPIAGVIALGGFGNLADGIMAENPHFVSPFGGATVIGVISALAWGLGYFGQPHIIVRFMALRSPSEAKQARRIGIGWMLLSVIGAGGTAMVGIAAHNVGLFKVGKEKAESVFIIAGQSMFPSIIAGFMLAAILAAIMSTISSQLLVTSSAVVEDIFNAKGNRKADASYGLTISRLTVLAVSVLAAVFAWYKTDSILNLVAFAWAGFGAAFGPIVVLALYWRKLTWQGALAGMVTGAVTVGIWGAFKIFGLYEILPGFLFATLVAYAVSLLTYKFNPEIDAEFTAAVRLSRATGAEIDAEYGAGSAYEALKFNPDGQVIR